VIIPNFSRDELTDAAFIKIEICFVFEFGNSSSNYNNVIIVHYENCFGLEMGSYLKTKAQSSYRNVVVS
jgi:hypothetical protein